MPVRDAYTLEAAAAAKKGGEGGNDEEEEETDFIELERRRDFIPRPRNPRNPLGPL